jgi:cell division protease FtsH
MTDEPGWLTPYRTTIRGVSLEADVVGLEPQKRALLGVAARLRHGEQLARMGGRIPSGVLLYGAPGTGKSLVWRALASELADCPAVELYGIPAGVLSVSRWDDLRTWIERRGPEAPVAVLYLDEIDSLARVNPAAPQARSQQLLVALSVMDGIAPTQRRVLWIAASNTAPGRSLDGALTRPGRLELHIECPLPDLSERVAILGHYLARTRSERLDLRRAARLTDGDTPARLVQIVEEAIARAIAADPDDPIVRWVHLEDAIAANGRVRREHPIPVERASAHEAGHALVAWALELPVTLAVVHVADGETRLEQDDQPPMTVREARARIAAAYAGMEAEALVLGEPALLSSADVWAAWSTAEDLAANGQLPGWGALPPGAFRRDSHSEPGLLYAAVTAITTEERARARQILAQREPQLRALAATIARVGHITAEDLPALLGELERGVSAG